MNHSLEINLIFFHLSSNLCPTHFESRLSKNVVKLYDVNKLQILI